jgi:hypothetical protein
MRRLFAIAVCAVVIYDYDLMENQTVDRFWISWNQANLCCDRFGSARRAWTVKSSLSQLYWAIGRRDEYYRAGHGKGTRDSNHPGLHVVWYDGTAEIGGTSFVMFAAVMERFAMHLQSKARVVLVNAEV